jgi:uncharacterized membrane protein YphA (DoxX/SURF4 family)
MKLFWRVLELVIGALFICAGVLKILDPLRFANDIENFHIVPWTMGVRLAFYLPWLEIACGAALILRRCYGGALIILSGLTLVFIGAIVSARWRGLDIKCGCFGHAIDNVGFSTHLIFNLAILLALGFLFGERKRSLPRPLP